jgi:hypothetical protein
VPGNAAAPRLSAGPLLLPAPNAAPAAAPPADVSRLTVFGCLAYIVYAPPYTLTTLDVTVMVVVVYADGEAPGSVFPLPLLKMFLMSVIEALGFFYAFVNSAYELSSEDYSEDRHDFFVVACPLFQGLCYLLCVEAFLKA